MYIFVLNAPEAFFISTYALFVSIDLILFVDGKTEKLNTFGI